jgi:hypothetical protein
LGLALWLPIAAGCVAAARSACVVQHGDRVVLYGTADDPDVFVWDSRVHLRTYHSGSLQVAEQLMTFATLVPPGTRAVAGSCLPRMVDARDRGDVEDAVAVRILDGPLAGRYGWVLGGDIRGVYHTLSGAAQTPAPHAPRR